MKKILFTTLALLISNFVFAEPDGIDPDLLKPMLYNITIEDSKHKIIYNTEVDNLMTTDNQDIHQENYIDNCINNKSIIESTKSDFSYGLKVSLLKNDDIATDILIEIKHLETKKKINTGECFIEEPVLSTATVKQNLPFLLLEQKINFKDQDGTNLKDNYYLKVHGKKIK